MPPWVAKEEMGTLLLASEMSVPIPRNRTVSCPGLPVADDCEDGEEVSRVGLRYSQHLMSCTITLAHPLTMGRNPNGREGLYDPGWREEAIREEPPT